MRGTGRRLLGGGLIVAALVVSATAARAEVVAREDNGFVVRIASEVTAAPAEAWKRLLTPAQWWQSQHTFSGDAANLTLDPQVGGCFCETLPRPDTMPPLQKGERWNGGVQHLRIVYLEPPRAIRLVGALGPLQSEALAATMTITVKPTEKGSRILFEYVVGGFMRYKSEDIAPAVDRMLTAQLASLASKLGPVAEPAAPSASTAPAGPPAPEGELPAVEPAAKPVVPLTGAESYSLPPAGAKPVPKQAPKPAPKPEPQPDPAPAADAVPAKSAPPKPAAPKPAPAVKQAPRTSPAPAAVQPPAAKSAPKPAVKAPAKPAAKAPAKPSAKAPDPEAEAHRDANAAFDAALSGAATP